jgi:hypothetical protein
VHIGGGKIAEQTIGDDKNGEATIGDGIRQYEHGGLAPRGWSFSSVGLPCCSTSQGTQH